MAWQTGPHAQAPQGVLCYGSDENPGEVTWDDEGVAGRAQLPPPPPQPVQAPFKRAQQDAPAAQRAAPAAHAPASTKHG